MRSRESTFFLEKLSKIKKNLHATSKRKIMSFYRILTIIPKIFSCRFTFQPTNQKEKKISQFTGIFMRLSNFKGE